MKMKFEKLMILVVVFVAGPATNVANSDLVALWALDGNANDSIGSNHGAEFGNPVYSGGILGRAIDLDGADDYVDCGTDRVLDIRNQITVAFWMKAEPTQNFQATMLAKGNESYRIALYHNDNFIEWACNGTPPDWFSGNLNVKDGRWHHVAGTYDGATKYLYVDGKVDALRTAMGKINVTADPVWIGGNYHYGTDRSFNGLIDDVAIFDHALSAEEVTRLSRYGGVTFTSEPTLLMLYNTVLRAETLIEEQKPREAATIIKNAIAEFEQWKQQDPNDVVSGHKVLSCDLHFLLAKAKEAGGAPKADVAGTYKQAVESGILSVPRQGPALLWLYENTDADTYDSVVEPFITNNSTYLKEVAAQSELMIREQKSKAAVAFLAGNLAAYTRWQKKHPFDEVIAEDILPEIYLRLAEAREATEASKDDVADVYKNVFKPSRLDYIPERVAALAWLVENERTDECAKAIESFTQERDTRACFKNVVRQICEHLEAKKNWAKFQWFLDMLFDRAEYPYDWVVFVESCLGNKTNRWGQLYYAYLDNKPTLMLGRDCAIAEQYMAEEKFTEAAELYRNILDRCVPDDDKGPFEFRLCSCLFYAGRYREAVNHLGDFIANNKGTHRSSVKEAMLMKGRAHVQLSEIDKAIDTFFAVMIEYPETKEAPETNFFVGYCYMLQSRFDQATEAFNLVVQDYASSSYASKARLCLIRIKDMSQ